VEALQQHLQDIPLIILLMMYHVKKKEYDETVNELFDSNIFSMITDPFYFNTRMKWQDRRKTLIDICGDVSDELVINSLNDLAPLQQLLNGKSVDDLRAQLKSQMKPIMMN